MDGVREWERVESASGSKLKLDRDGKTCWLLVSGVGRERENSASVCIDVVISGCGVTPMGLTNAPNDGKPRIVP